MHWFSPLTPNDPYRGRTAPLTSKRCILYIHSTNTVTEYFKRGVYSQFFSSSKCSLFDNSNVFGSCVIYILYTGCAKIKKKIRRRKVNGDVSLIDFSLNCVFYVLGLLLCFNRFKLLYIFPLFYMFCLPFCVFCAFVLCCLYFLTLYKVVLFSVYNFNDHSGNPTAVNKYQYNKPLLIQS
jgi:hypothetical protein